MGGAGGDVLGGETGADRAQYSDATAGLTADLQVSGNNTGIAAGDSYFSIEDLYGSGFNDILRGNAHANVIWGERQRLHPRARRAMIFCTASTPATASTAATAMTPLSAAAAAIC